MNVFFVTSEPFGTRQYKRYGLDFLHNQEISLKAINLSIIFKEKYTSSEKKSFLNVENLKKIDYISYNQFKIIG